jgi:hypothetical protein
MDFQRGLARRVHFVTGKWPKPTALFQVSPADTLSPIEFRIHRRLRSGRAFKAE